MTLCALLSCEAAPLPLSWGSLIFVGCAHRLHKSGLASGPWDSQGQWFFLPQPRESVTLAQGLERFYMPNRMCNGQASACNSACELHVLTCPYSLIGLVEIVYCS